jgi:hypothetical protein
MTVNITYFFMLSDLNINREKKRRQQGFDLVQEVHASEYANLPRPIDPKTKKPIEPAHKFEVTIEGDSLSQRKSVVRFCFCLAAG